MVATVSDCFDIIELSNPGIEDRFIMSAFFLKPNLTFQLLVKFIFART